MRETFAVAPGIEEVGIMVVRRGHLPEGGREHLSAIYVGAFERADLAELDWTGLDPVAHLDHAPDTRFDRRGRTYEVASLDVSDSPDLASVLEGTAAGLECAPDVSGKALV